MKKIKENSSLKDACPEIKEDEKPATLRKPGCIDAENSRCPGV